MDGSLAFLAVLAVTASPGRGDSRPGRTPSDLTQDLRRSSLGSLSIPVAGRDSGCAGCPDLPGHDDLRPRLPLCGHPVEPVPIQGVVPGVLHPNQSEGSRSGTAVGARSGSFLQFSPETAPDPG